MLEVSAAFVFCIGVIVGAILGSIGIVIVALVYKGGDDKNGGKK